MKKIFLVLSLMLIAVMLFGCGETDNSTVTQNQLPPQEYNKTFTLQGKIMDAITGAAMGNDSTGTITMFLVQGDQDRTPTKLHTNPNDPLVGEYSFSGIPAQARASETVYKLVVRRNGYQDFAANVSFLASTPTVSGFSNDGTLNMIGNIYLYALGLTPGDVKVNVLSNHGVPVPNATVLLQQDASNNDNSITNPTAGTTIMGNRLTPVAGLYPSMTATTDANGVATFSGSNLVLGGSYIAKALAINFQGDELQTTGNTTFIIGTNSETRVINMGVAGNPFFATSASNQVLGTITPSGILSVTFNEPVSMTSTTCLATITGGGVITSGTTTGTTNMPVIGTLSADNLTFTLTPNITTAPTSTGATITYSGCGTLILQNTQTPPATNTLFTGGVTDVLNSTTGNRVSGVVRLTSF